MVLCTLGFAVMVAAQQPAMKCPDLTDRKGPEYRIGLAGHGTKKFEGDLYLFISIDPSHFVREDMLALAERLNKDFCYERRLTAVILDDYYAARHPMRNTKEYRDAERGKYYLNRNSGENYIKFSPERGKPWNEVAIDLKAETREE
jgi:hypothetical protein